eukprot:scaffold2917_cov191-Amphora_coffeaeformis.AAC.22
MLNYDKVERNALSLDVNILPAWDLVANTVKEFMLPAVNKKILLSWNVTEKDEIVDVASDVESNAHKSEQLAEKIASSYAFSVTRRVYDKYFGICCPTPSSLQTITALPSRADAQVRRFGDVRITVTDTGSGVTQEQLSKVFREGSQFNVNEIQNMQGSGLGTYISKEILERHQGSLSAQSAGLGMVPPLQWNCLSTKLPRPTMLSHLRVSMGLLLTPVSVQHPSLSSSEEIQDEESTLPARANIDYVTDASKTASEGRNPLRVLVVEDRNGHSCIDVENGQLAVDLYRQTPGAFDTILIDYEMPNKNGPSAVKEMRRLGCDLVILGVTGNMLAEDVDYFCKCGANAVLPKTFR